MQKPKIILFGINGQVGFELHQRLSSIANLIAIDRTLADFTKPEQVINVLQQEQPQIIVNAVAYTAVDKAEDDKELAQQINAETPAKIAQYARNSQCLFVHYSTDFVFDGTANTAYREDEKTSPLSVYGTSKLDGDIAIQKSGCASITFRTSWVYGLRGKNFLLTMRRLAQSKDRLSIVNDQIGSPTWCGFIAQVTLEALIRILQEMGDRFDINKIPQNLLGLFNLSASNSTSWYQFACAIIESDPDKENHQCKAILPIPGSEYPTPAKRPNYSVLDNTKLNTNFGIAIPTWEEQLQHCLGSDV